MFKYSFVIYYSSKWVSYILCFDDCVAFLFLKELDVAIVKATNHVEYPPKERHVRSELIYIIHDSQFMFNVHDAFSFFIIVCVIMKFVSSKLWITVRFPKLLLINLCLLVFLSNLALHQHGWNDNHNVNFKV